MSKKKINLKTKLSKDSAPVPGKIETTSPQIPGELMPTSVRLSQPVLDKLDHMVKVVGNSTSVKVSRASIISALILMGGNFKTDRLVKVFKESL
jgi:hypothetical protein